MKKNNRKRLLPGLPVAEETSVDACRCLFQTGRHSNTERRTKKGTRGFSRQAALFLLHSLLVLARVQLNNAARRGSQAG